MIMLLAMTVSWSAAGMGVLAAIATAATVAWLNKKDSGIEERRLQAIDFSSNLDALGLDILSGVIKKYAVGDYGGVFAAVRTLYQEVKTPELLLDRLRNSFRKQIVKRLENPEECGWICDVVRPFIDKLDATKVKREPLPSEKTVGAG